MHDGNPPFRELSFDEIVSDWERSQAYFFISCLRRSILGERYAGVGYPAGGEVLGMAQQAVVD
jgi:hypothetical protein